MKPFFGIAAVFLILMGSALAQPYGGPDHGYRERDYRDRERSHGYRDREDTFEEREYLRCNPDVEQAVNSGQQQSGWAHYESIGRREGRRLSCGREDAFDEREYLRCNPDVDRAVLNGEHESGWAHYRSDGRREGRPLSC